MDNTYENNKQKEEISKKYNINLENIKHIKLNDGKEIFEFIDPITKQVKMIENLDYKRSLKEQFEEEKNNLNNLSEDASKNAEDIFEQNSKHKNNELKIISLEEFKNNNYRYRKQIRNLETEKKEKVKALLKRHKELKLEYINIENAIGIDEEQNVIDVKYDFKTNKAEFVNPITISYTNDLESESAKAENDINLDNIDFDTILDEFNIIENIEEINPDKEVNVSGVVITSSRVKDVYNNPELLERDNTLSDKERSIMGAIINSIKKRFSKKQEKSNTKVFVLKNDENKKAA